MLGIGLDLSGASRRISVSPLVFNGDYEYTPASNVAQTATGWIDGTATGTGTRTPYDWHFSKGGSGATAMFDTAEKHGGDYSMKGSVTATSSYFEIRGADTDYGTTASEGFAMNASTSYRFSYMMKTANVSGDSNHGFEARVLESNSSGTNLGGLGLTSYIKTNTSWTLYSVIFTTQATTVRGHVELRCYGHTGAGTLVGDAWYDNVMVERL